jgi:hypothetical protein
MEVRQMAPEDPQVRGFLPVIELGEHRLPELGDDFRHRITRADLGPPLEKCRDVCDGGEIGLHLTIDAGPLNLDGYGPTVPQRRAVDLSERCSGDWLRFERRKDGREGTTQFRRENRFNLGEGKWLDPILKAPERLQVLRGKQVATG